MAKIVRMELEDEESLYCAQCQQRADWGHVFLVLNEDKTEVVKVWCPTCKGELEAELHEKSE